MLKFDKYITIINHKKIKSFIFDSYYKTDRIFFICLILGMIGIFHVFFSKKLSKSDLVEVEATVKNFEIEKTYSYKNRQRHDDLNLSLIEYPVLLKICEVFDGSENKYLNRLEFGVTKIQFLIKKVDFKNLNKPNQIKVYSLITDNGDKLIDVDLSIVDDGLNRVFIKYVSILAFISGFIYFFGFRLS